MDDIIPILRMVERLLVVGFAGISIFLGYRLFFHLPLEKSHEGTIELPGIKVVLSKVGPGVFFSVFGTLVLLQSLHEKIELKKNNGDSVAEVQTNTEHFVGATENALSGKDSSRGIVQKRNAIFEQIGELNCSLKMLESVKGNEISESMRIAYHDAKISMLKQIWDDDGWGSIDKLDATPNNHKLKSVFFDTSANCLYN